MSRLSTRYTVEEFTIAHPNGLRIRHDNLESARYSFRVSCQNVDKNSGTAWCNLIRRDSIGRETYLAHHEKRES